MSDRVDRLRLQARALRSAVDGAVARGTGSRSLVALLGDGVTPIDELTDRLRDHAALMATVRAQLDTLAPVPLRSPPSQRLAQQTDALLAARATLERVAAADDELRAALGRAARLVAELGPAGG